MGATSTVQPYLPLGFETLNFRSVLYTNFLLQSGSSGINTSATSATPVRIRSVASLASSKINSIVARFTRFRLVSGSAKCAISSSSSAKRIREFRCTSVVAANMSARSIGVRAALAAAQLQVSCSVPTLLGTVTLTPGVSSVETNSTVYASRYTNAVSQALASVVFTSEPFLVTRNGAVKTEIIPTDKASGTVLVPIASKVPHNIVTVQAIKPSGTVLVPAAPQVPSTIVLVPTSKPTGDIVVTRNKYLYDGF